MVKNKRKRIEKQVQKQTSNVVALASVIALVILVIFAEDIPTYIGVGLVGSALGAKWEDVVKWLKGKM